MQRRLVVLAPVLCVLASLACDSGDERRGYSFGNGYEYRPETIERLEARLNTGDWRLAIPPRNLEGMIEVVHERTDLIFVLIPRGKVVIRPEDGVFPGRVSRELTVPALLLCRTECTYEAWTRIRPHDQHSWSKGEFPVIGVSWNQAKAWCATTRLDLPTEIEWIHAVRAGVAETEPGENPVITKAYARIGLPYREGPLPVASKLPNPWGLYDLIGNACEWCEPFSPGPADPFAYRHRSRPRRGGGWTTKPPLAPEWVRSVSDPIYGTAGFRPVFRLSM